ncbi:helicase-related protein [Roseateles sp. DB2]|uniref:helicase-related protein n=1 Tax=Roseateles sp. DB2 TaxID=3453717 RepID=UPI003EEF6DC8
MATSKTPRRKAATEIEAAPAKQASVKKRPATESAKAEKAAKPAKAEKAVKAEKADKAAKPAAKPKRPAAKPAAPAEAVAVKKAATKSVAAKTSAAKASAAKTTVKTSAAKKSAEKANAGKASLAKASLAKAAAVAAPAVARKSGKKAELVSGSEPVEPAAKSGRKKAPAAAAPVEAKATRPARSRKITESQAPAVPEAEAEVSKPARKTRKSSPPAVAAPVAALVAEVAAALEEPAAPVARKRAGGRGKGAVTETATEVVTEAAAALAPSPSALEEAPAKPARKTRPPKKAKPLAADAVEQDAAEQAKDEPGPGEPPAIDGPDWRWHKAQAGLFGSYAVHDADGEPLATLELQGGIGHYRCNCAEFQDSEEGSCAHGQWLLEQLAAAREGQADRLAAGPDTAWSELGLSAGWQRRLVWRLGQGASSALRSLAEDCADEQGRFIAPLEGQVLPMLLQAAAAEGHELRVGAEVWQQLALSADAGDRVERLAQAFEQGLASPALQAQVKAVLPDMQWEAALFAVCAGRALLADESPLPQRPSAVAAAQLWQSHFGVGAVAIVAPSTLHEAWREDVIRLLGAWPTGWVLQAPTDLSPAAGCELLIVDAVDALGDVLPALRQLGAAHLILLSHRELLGTELLSALVAWIDEARRGPYAALRRLGREAGKRQQREVLETVMLARRRRDLAPGLPVQLLTHWVRVPAGDSAGLALDTTDVQCVQRLHQRWSRLGSLSAGEQLQLQQALLRLRLGDAAQAEKMGEARAAALVRLLPELVPGRAERVVVFAQQDAALRPLALALQELGLPLANLRQHQSAEVRAMELQAWSEGEASVLLATDAACTGLDLRQPGSVLVHADLCWNPALMKQRLARLAAEGSEGAGPSDWALVLEAGFDPVQLAAHGQEASLPSGLQDGEAGAIPFLAGSDLAAFMEAVGRALGALKAA